MINQEQEIHIKCSSITLKKLGSSEHFFHISRFKFFKLKLNITCHCLLGKTNPLNPIFFLLIPQSRLVKYFMVLRAHYFIFLRPFSTYTDKWTNMSSTVLKSFFEKQIIICHDTDMVFQQLTVSMALKYFKDMHTQWV